MDRDISGRDRNLSDRQIPSRPLTRQVTGEMPSSGDPQGLSHQHGAPRLRRIPVSPARGPSASPDPRVKARLRPPSPPHCDFRGGLFSMYMSGSPSFDRGQLTLSSRAVVGGDRRISGMTRVLSLKGAPQQPLPSLRAQGSTGLPTLALARGVLVSL